MTTLLSMFFNVFTSLVSTSMFQDFILIGLCLWVVILFKHIIDIF